MKTHRRQARAAHRVGDSGVFWLSVQRAFQGVPLSGGACGMPCGPDAPPAWCSPAGAALGCAPVRCVSKEGLDEARAAHRRTCEQPLRPRGRVRAECCVSVARLCGKRAPPSAPRAYPQQALKGPAGASREPRRRCAVASQRAESRPSPPACAQARTARSAAAQFSARAWRRGRATRPALFLRSGAPRHLLLQGRRASP